LPPELPLKRAAAKKIAETVQPLSSVPAMLRSQRTRHADIHDAERAVGDVMMIA